MQTVEARLDELNKLKYFYIITLICRIKSIISFYHGLVGEADYGGRRKY